MTEGPRVNFVMREVRYHVNQIEKKQNNVDLEQLSSGHAGRNVFYNHL